VPRLLNYIVALYLIIGRHSGPGDYPLGALRGLRGRHRGCF
jgi:hypothetical protein